MADNTVTLALVSAVASAAATIVTACSPFLVAYFNNHHQRKMKEIEIYTVKRIQALEAYLDAVEKYIVSGSDEDFKRLSGSVYLYVESRHWYLLDKIADMVKNDQSDAARLLLAELCKCLDLGYTKGAQEKIKRSKLKSKYTSDD